MLSVQPRSAEAIAYAPARDRTRPALVSFGLGWAMLLFAADAWMLVLCAAIAFALGSGGLDGVRTHPNALVAPLAVCGVWLFLFERFGLYRRSFNASPLDEVYSAVAAIGLGTIPGFALASIPALWVPRPTLVILAVTSAVGVGVLRAFMHSLRATVGVETPRIAVVGSPDGVATVARELPLDERESAWRLPLDDFSDVVAAGPIAPRVEPLLERAVDHGCGMLLVTECVSARAVREMLRATQARGMTLALAAMPARVQGFDVRVRRHGNLGLVCPRPLEVCRPGVDLARRVADLSIALPAIVVLAPLLAAIAIAIALDSRGPVLYRQTRVGRYGRVFDIIKFRTMPPDAERGTGPVWAMPADARATRLGRFLRRTSLDELPQLFNVVRGDMALVGPRPERPAFVDQFRRELKRYDERQVVRPGITGWSHVNMRRDIDASRIGERLAYDLEYIEHWSPLFDASILVKTLAEFLFHRAA